MNWVISFDAGYVFCREVDQKSYRLGISKSKLMRKAVEEYLMNHPKEKEAEERKMFFPDEAD